MKSIHGLPLLTLACILSLYCTSCTSAKKLTIMRDLSANQTVPGPKPPPVYHLRSNDNIYVGISTTDQDLTKMTDPTSNGTALGNSYEGMASKAVNGNIVDLDGNLTLPMLGKIRVAGLTITEAEDTIRGITKQY